MEEKRIGESFIDQIKDAFPCKEQNIQTYSPLALAYIGDGVYDLIIRTVIVLRGNKQSHKLHKEAVAYVKAESQAKMIDGLLPFLTEEEEAVYKRGRNASPHSYAKNALKGDYRKATGFEALIGYLYLQNRMERVLELTTKGIELLNKE